MPLLIDPYPWKEPKTLSDVIELLRDICSKRKKDQLALSGVNNTFLSGRKVAKIPSSSADVSSDDRLGDMNITNAALYVLIDNAGTPEWRMATLATF